MRRSLLFKVMGASAEEREPAAVEDALTEAQIARRAMVEAFGPRTAGWLVMRHRRQLHKAGAIDFKVPMKPTAKNVDKLRYFFTAMDFLKKRPGWAVNVTAHKGIRTFRLRWLLWKSRTPSRSLS